MEFSKEDKRVISQMIKWYRGVTTVLEELSELIGAIVVILGFLLLVQIAMSLGEIISQLPISGFIVVVIELLIVFGGLFWILTKVTR